MTRTIGLVGAGAMGSALGACWIAGGSAVRTTVAGRSARTRELAAAAGLELAPTLEEVVAADVVVSIVPPGVAVDTARAIADAIRRTGAEPLVVDLNAVAPATMRRVARALDGIPLVDGSISGSPPRPDAGPTVYLSGPRAAEIAAIPAPWCRVVHLGDEVGTASALKMTTSSMYKGTNALVLQALRTAAHFGVLDEFLADTARIWPAHVPGWPRDAALAATKSARFVDEMLEIAATQREAGLAGELFEGAAEVFSRVQHSDLGRTAPEAIGPSIPVDEVIRRLE